VPGLVWKALQAVLSLQEALQLQSNRIVQSTPVTNVQHKAHQQLVQVLVRCLACKMACR
jgi:hypothetical protein